MPGLVIALSLTFWALRAPGASVLYQTVPLLIVAYVVHFGAQALRSSELAVGSVPRALDESALLLGASSWRRAVTIHLPLMLPGLLAGGGLVMLSVLKELPATLLLAPIGYQTLTTRVWGAFEDGFLAEAGFGAIALVAASAAPDVADRPPPQPPPRLIGRHRSVTCRETRHVTLRSAANTRMG